MEFTIREEAAMPIDASFAALTRFGRFAGLARKRGAKVERLDPDPATGLGLRWDVHFAFQGTERQVLLSLVERVPPRLLRFDFDSVNFFGEIRLSLSPLGAEQSQIDGQVTIAAKTLKSKVLLQTLRLGRGRVEARFADYVQRGLRKAEAEWRAEKSESGQGN